MDLPYSRKIIHCDCDCFYAAVEMRDNADLRHRPLAVGGSPQARGVIATCNYLARQFGIHSAMSSAYALKLCPELVIVPPRFEVYREAAKDLLAIYRDFTALVEPLSLDEAYLDVSETLLYHNNATHMAQVIRQRVRSELGLTVSAGVAPNKFLAKIASDWKKPDGLFVIKPHRVEQFVAQLPVSKLFGVGKITAAKLEKMGIYTCQDLRQTSLTQLTQQLGKFGQQLAMLAWGIDNRGVEPQRDIKSLSVERTLPTDLPDLAACLQALPTLFPLLKERINRQPVQNNIRHLYVKLKFFDFSQTTVECLGNHPDEQQYLALCKTAFARKALPVRLLGIGVRLSKVNLDIAQLSLF
jgi:DNA polymerase-4